jgi:hypothetical protein
MELAVHQTEYRLPPARQEPTFDGSLDELVPLFVGITEWPRWAARIKPHLEKIAAASGGRYLAEDIAAALASGAFSLWLVLDGADIACAVISEFMQYPRLNALRIVGLVGHRPRRWMHLLKLLEISAAVNWNCARIEGVHPPGYERMLLTGGWKISRLMCEKDLA